MRSVMVQNSEPAVAFWATCSALLRQQIRSPLFDRCSACRRSQGSELQWRPPGIGSLPMVPVTMFTPPGPTSTMNIRGV